MSLFYCFQVRRFERLCPVQLLVHNNLKTSETEGASSSKTTGKSSKEDRNFCLKGKNPWENTNLGWLPNPRNERHILSNQLLQEFYQAVEKVSFYKDPLHFKNDFKVEERRRNDYSNLLDSLKEGLAFIQSDNDAAVGRFFENNDVILTRKDRAVLLLNRNKLSQLVAEIEENSSEIKIHHDSLSEENKLTLRHDWEKFKSDFDKDILKALLDLKSDAETKILVLKEKLSKIDELFPIDPSKELKEKKNLK